jgi:DNA helicase II / ATP-dependent DNA helicase PcrA
MARKVIKIARDKSLRQEGETSGLRIDYRGMLNPEQYEAVTSIRGPLLIIAGAGSGKTRVITYRTAYLAERGVPPERVVLLTFTRRAAREMLSRAEALSGINLRGVAGGTFHSFANTLLHRYGKHVGLDQNFTVLDQADSEDAVKAVRDQLGLGSENRRFPKKGTLFAIISKARNKGVTVEEVVAGEFSHFEDDLDGIEQVAAGYRKLKAARHLVDFDDLLFHLRDLLAGEKGPDISNRYKYVMADEYQDTNQVQADIVRRLARIHGNVCVVGDDAQCIYTWRGSSFENILKVGEAFPEVKIITLERNYRSTQQILDVANQVMKGAERSYTKILRAQQPEGEKPLLVQTESTEEQAEFIAGTVLQLREEGVSLNDQAVLCRAVWHFRDLELELTRRNIPYVVYGGLKFGEAAHVKDLLAVLRVGLNPRDDLSLRRILTLMPRVGPATCDKIVAAMFASEDPLETLAHLPLNLSAPAKERIAKLSQTLAVIGKAEEKPSKLVERAKKFYMPLLKERYDDHPKREPDLDLIVSFAGPYSGLQSFLADMMLTPNRDRSQDKAVESDDEDEHLILSTVHSAKGLEFHTVFMPHLVDGLFPSSRSFGDPESLEEERRLFYVAVTRAKENLFLLQPSFVPGPQMWDPGGGISKLTRYVDPAVMKLVEVADIEWE